MLAPLIDAGEAVQALGGSQTLFLDGSWTFPGGPKPLAEGYIPGSVIFDIDAVKDTSNPLPHMLPSTSEFEQHVQAMGITGNTRVVVWDRFGLFSAARVWWMFRVMGHENICVLDGGLPAWIKAGGKISTSASDPIPGSSGSFTANFQPHLVANMHQVLAASDRHSHQIVDARPPGRFAGVASEPRKGMRAGHIPGARNLPFGTLLDSNNLMCRPAEVFAEAGLGGDQRPVITSCGSGVTACILALGLKMQGIDATVYDGSWTEWGAQSDTPIATGSG